MTVAIIISIILFVIGMLVMLNAILFDWKGWVFKAGGIIASISLIAIVSLALYHVLQ